MAENPLKLFARRSERFASPTMQMRFGRLLKRASSRVLVWVILTFVMSRFWAPAHARRLESFWKEFADDFDLTLSLCAAFHQGI